MEYTRLQLNSSLLSHLNNLATLYNGTFGSAGYHVGVFKWFFGDELGYIVELAHRKVYVVHDPEGDYAEEDWDVEEQLNITDDCELITAIQELNEWYITRAL